MRKIKQAEITCQHIIMLNMSMLWEFSLWATTLLVLSLSSWSAQAADSSGFGLSATRVIIMGDSPGGAQITAQNNTDNVYLVQSLVYPAQGVTGYPHYMGANHQNRLPFIVTPPLKRMEPHSNLPLRILTVPQNSLPQDRESLFFLSAKAIPSVLQPVAVTDSGMKAKSTSSEVGQSAPQVLLALQQFIKLYYRPSRLKPLAIYEGDVAAHLNMSQSGNHLRVHNPTPYYITFGQLKINGHPVEPAALRVLTPPMGEQDYPLPAGVVGGKVEWQLIDEFGLVTEKRTQVLP